MHTLLDSTQIHQRLHQLDNWVLDAEKGSIQKNWEFDSFQTAVKFFVHVSELAEDLDHHPEFLSNYIKMQIRLTTHDVNGLTNKDFELALQIDALHTREFSSQVYNDQKPK